MSFTSPAFFGFVLAALAAYYLVPKRVQWMVLLAGSCCFYISGGLGMAPFMVITVAVTYLAGRLLEKKAEAGPRPGLSVFRRRLVVFLTCLINFGMLFYLKYWGPVLSALITGYSAENLLLPLGISFYMFQSVGYVVDVYRGKHAPEKNPFKYALFVSFFPQVVQGPISRYGQLAPQLTARRSLGFADLKYGIQLAMWGYFKKAVIADRASVLVNAVFGSVDAPGSVAALGVFFYCIQLYCDFSGGIDITRGVARMFGVDLAENFRRPIFAESLADYWRRWHITLGSWMRDYVFYPLALSKPFARLGKLARRHIKGPAGKIIPTSIATFVVYFLIGVWHGAGLKFIAFGLWNGVVITASLLCEPAFVKLRALARVDGHPAVWRALRILRTCLLVFIGRYLTRASSLSSALKLLWATFTRFNASALFGGAVFTLGLDHFDFCVVLAGAAAVVAVEFFQERGLKIRQWLEGRGFALQWAAIAAPLLILLFLGVLRQDYISSAFIYQGF